MLKKEPILNTRFGYADDIVILCTGLITFYTAAALATDIKNILK